MNLGYQKIFQMYNKPGAFSVYYFQNSQWNLFEMQLVCEL